MHPLAPILDRIIAMTTPVCPVHNMPMALRPAGFSKKGKPYTAFWSCQLRECGYTENAAQETPQPAPVARSAPAPTPNPSEVSPRFQAACVALQAAAYGPGSPAEVMDRAARYYHYFLKPSFTGDVPVPTVPAVPGAEAP